MFYYDEDFELESRIVEYSVPNDYFDNSDILDERVEPDFDYVDDLPF